MAKRKSYYDIIAQIRRLLDLCEHNSQRYKEVMRIKELYITNIRKSRKTSEYADKLSEAIEKDEANGNGWYERVHSGTTPLGGPDPSEYVFHSDIDHYKLETKWMRYHHTRQVYQFGSWE